VPKKYYEGGKTMDFQFSDEQTMFRNMAREFSNREIIPVLAEYGEADHIPPKIMLQLWQKMAAANLIGVTMPQEYGGLGIDCICQSLIIEEISRVSGGIGLSLSTTAWCCLFISMFGTEEQKREILPQMCRGKGMASVAFTEPDTGSNPKAITTKATLDGDEYVINGTKRFITLSDIDGPIILITKDSETEGGNQLSAFVAQKNIPGYKCKAPWKKIGMHGPATCDIYFENMRIPASNLIGKHGQGFQIMLESMEFNHLNHNAVILGLCQAAFDESMKYAQERMVKGKPITQFQTIQTLIADIAVGLEVSRSQLYRLASIVNSGDIDEMKTQSRITRIFLTETLNEVARKALRVHGCYGYTEDFKIARILRDALFGEVVEVVNDVQRLILASHLLR
jgi:alkylation response protein AidB-like acyl-CoA dehydrogenase